MYGYLMEPDYVSRSDASGLEAIGQTAQEETSRAIRKKLRILWVCRQMRAEAIVYFFDSQFCLFDPVTD